VVVTGTLPPGEIPLAGSPETVTPASVPAVAEPEPDPDVVQKAKARALTTTAPRTPAPISARLLVNM